MRPQPASTMCFCTARLNRNAPRRWTAITVSQSSSVILNSRLSRGTPALLTSTVGGPSSSATRADGGVHLRRVGDVRADAERRAAGVVDPRHRVGAGRLVQVDDRDGHAVRGQLAGGGRADAAGGAGDDRDPAAADCVMRPPDRESKTEPRSRLPEPSSAPAQPDPAVAVARRPRIASSLPPAPVLLVGEHVVGVVGLGGQAAQVDHARLVARLCTNTMVPVASSARCTSTPGGAGHVDVRAGAAADLGRLPQGADHPLEPGQQRLRVVPLRGDVDLLVAELAAR